MLQKTNARSRTQRSSESQGKRQQHQRQANDVAGAKKMETYTAPPALPPPQAPRAHPQGNSPPSSSPPPPLPQHPLPRPSVKATSTTPKVFLDERNDNAKSGKDGHKKCAKTRVTVQFG